VNRIFTIRAVSKFAIAFYVLIAALIVNAEGTTRADETSTLPNRVALLGHVLPALANATLDQSKSKSSADDELLTLTLVLKRSDPDGFADYLREVYDPASPSFRKFLTQVQLTERFGPSKRAYDDVLSFLRSQNLTLSEGSANRMTMTVRGMRSDAERAFATRVDHYAIGEQKFFANASDPALPADIAAYVQAVNGLSNLATPKPLLDHLPDTQANRALWYALCANQAVNGGPSAYTGGALAFFKILLGEVVFYLSLLDSLLNIAGAADQSSNGTGAQYAKCVNQYNKKYHYSLIGGKDPPPPAWQAADGTGQTVGLTAFDSFVQSDVANYITLMGEAAGSIANVSQVHVNGGATLGSNQDEVLLDIASVLTAAPGAKIVVYDAPFTGAGTSFQTLFNAMINGGVDIISNSWAYCENQTTLADVQSIDTILQGAAASGISVFSGSGDRGSTCLNGSANVAHVPATSPHITAVGGTSTQQYPGFTFGTETWWDNSGDTPPGGQGGYGVSRFFSRPGYQDGMTSSAMRSIPDVAAAADPKSGIMICQASAGGCPTGARYGGTSMSAPLWAGLTALLNQTQGTNLGFLNPQIYPYANTDAFHDATALSSDFAHVGLGSPNLARLHLRLTGQTVGPVSATVSVLKAYAQTTHTMSSGAVDLPAFADGLNQTFVTVTLADAMGNPVGGKIVSLATVAPSNVVFTPTSLATDANTGVAIFYLTNTTVETVTVRATDVTDGIVLADTARVAFVTPPAAGGSIVALSGTAAADGMSTDTITVTLQDSLGRPTPGKRVTLSQTGSSVINGPSPSVTNASGQIQFTVTNTKQENVFYAAFDVSDGNLRVPGGTTVNFNASGGDNCGNTNMGDPNITAAPGYTLTPFATGFLPKNTAFGNIAASCRGASGIAFNTAGELFVAFGHTGDIYKFSASGGIASAATKITATALGPGLTGITFGHDGKLYAAFQATTGDFFTGAVKEINPTTGVVVRTVATSLTCASYIATDPVSGDLFVDDSCAGGGSDNGSIWRINNPGSATPTTTVYASTPGINGGLTFSPGGTLYVLSYTQNGVARIAGTNTPQPAQVTVLPGITGPALNIVALGTLPNGDAKTLLLSNVTDSGGFAAGIKAFDITTNPATTTSLLVNNAYANVQITGPDGCQYASMSVAVYKIANADGSCPLVLNAPMLSLSPSITVPNPVQGSARSLTASFHYLNVPAGTPVWFVVSGTNTLYKQVLTDATGRATFTYVGFSAGTDVIRASARFGGNTYTSNQASITWAGGQHTTSLTLNTSPTAGIAGTRATLTASLFDLSVTPAAAIVGATINMIVGGQSCNAVTNSSGVASCFLILSTVGNFTLNATYAGSVQNAPANATIGFVVTAPRSLDIDGNGKVDALTDGLLLVRWLSGRTGSALVNRAIGQGAERAIAADVVAYLTALRPVLDIDGNGQFDALTDGLLIIRYLTGFRGDELVEGALGAGATRSSSADVEAYIQSLLPP
jgi:Pro-kumamolisin, activation domain/Bacterial Ig-like domain (group 1)